MYRIEIFELANSNARFTFAAPQHFSRTVHGRRIDPIRHRLPGPVVAGAESVLTPDALQLLAELHRRFEPTRQALLAARQARQARFDAGELPDFRSDTRNIREADWRVAPIPAALQDRRVEITVPSTAR
jgi:malate synthase